MHQARHIQRAYSELPRLKLPVGDWYQMAACRAVTDPDIFFPENATGPEVDQARTYCESCPVTAECAAVALSDSGHEGVWAGVYIPRGSTMENRYQRRRARKELERSLEVQNAFTG